MVEQEWRTRPAGAVEPAHWERVACAARRWMPGNTLMAGLPAEASGARRCLAGAVLEEGRTGT